MFALAFCEAGVNLPVIRTLILGLCCGIVIASCPNVRKTVTREWLHKSFRSKVKRAEGNLLARDLQAVGGALQLTHLKMMERWDVGFLEGKRLPHYALSM